MIMDLGRAHSQNTNLYPYLKAARHAGTQSSFWTTPNPSKGMSYPEHTRDELLHVDYIGVVTAYQKKGGQWLQATIPVLNSF